MSTKPAFLIADTRFSRGAGLLQSDVYEEFCSEKEREQLSDSERGLRAISPSFFPAYRCPSEPDTVPAALRAPAPAMAAPDEIQVAQNG